MSKKTVKNMSELKDSRILYEKDLPPFGYILVSLTAILLKTVAIIITSKTQFVTLLFYHIPQSAVNCFV